MSELVTSCDPAVQYYIDDVEIYDFFIPLKNFVFKKLNN